MDLQTQQAIIANRHKLLDAMLQQRLSPVQQQTAGGFVLPNYATNAANLISQGLLNKGINQNYKNAGNLENQIQQGSLDAANQIKAQLSSQNPDLVSAAIDTAANPYLSQNKNLQNVMQALIRKKQGSSSNPYSTIGAFEIPDPNNPTKKITVQGFVDTRNKTVTPIRWENGQFNTGGQGVLAQTPQYSYTAQLTKSSGAEQGKKDVDAAMNGIIQNSISYNMVSGKTKATRDMNKPQIEANLDQSTEKLGILENNIQRAKDQAGFWTTGLLGKLGSFLPGSPQYNLGQTLLSIRSNIGLDRLMELKRVGGGLGSVTEAEHALLQADLASLAQSQGPEQLKHNLDIIQKHARRAWDRVAEVAKKEYGINVQNPMGNQQNNSSNNQSNTQVLHFDAQGNLKQ